MPGSTSYVVAGSGAGRVSFELAGYGTLACVNCCADTLTVTRNGTELLSAAFNLDDGGLNPVFFGSPTVTY